MVYGKFGYMGEKGVAGSNGAVGYAEGGCVAHVCVEEAALKVVGWVGWMWVDMF